MRAVMLSFAVFALAACDAPPPAGNTADAHSGADARTRPHAEDGTKLYFANLQDGDTVTAPFRVVFGLSGMGVAPAGTEVENTGHHHLLINTRLEGEALEFAVPNDDQHLHFGGGQTETVLDLPPGEHVLQLVLGDHLHVPHDPPVMSERITITVR